MSPTESPEVDERPPAPAEAQPTPWETTKSFIRRLGPAGPLAILAATFPPIGGFVLIGFIYKIAPWLIAHKALGLVTYVGGFATMAALALLPTYACSILGGWTFKFAVGFPASMVAFVGASFLSYLVNSRAAGDRVVRIVREHPKWEAVRAALLDAGFWKALWIITLIRLPPTSPFAAANFVFGTIRAPLIPFLLGTLIGMAPRTGAVVWAASHASTLNFAEARNLWSYVLMVVLTIAVIAIIGRYANDAVHRVTRRDPDQPRTP